MNRGNRAPSSRSLGVVLTLALLACWPGQALSAPVLYGTTLGPGSPGGTSSLYTINPTTGATTLIGDTGFAINGLNYYNGTLYAVQAGFGGNLLTLNTTTGAGTVIGPTGDATGNGFDRAVLLAIDSSGNAFTWYDPSNDDLASVNLATGAATIVGESGIGTAAHGISFLGSTLYLVNFDGSVYTVNTATGAATFVGNAGTTAHHGDLNPDDGLYYGLQNIATTTSNVLVSLDLTTQTQVNTVSLDQGIHAVAFADGVAPIPEPTTLALFALCAAGAGVYGRCRRRQPA